MTPSDLVRMNAAQAGCVGQEVAERCAGPLGENMIKCHCDRGNLADGVLCAPNHVMVPSIRLVQ